MKNKTIVNGEEVEYFHIQQGLDGNVIVTIEQKFDIVTAHMSEIMKRIRADGYECVVSKDLHHNIIFFILRDKSDAYGVLKSLDIPTDIYQVMDDTDGKWIYIYVEDLPKYRTMKENGVNYKGVKV